MLKAIEKFLSKEEKTLFDLKQFYETVAPDKIILTTHSSDGIGLTCEVNELVFMFAPANLYAKTSFGVINLLGVDRICSSQLIDTDEPFINFGIMLKGAKGYHDLTLYFSPFYLND